MKKLLLAALLALVPSIASAQTPPAVGVPATPFSGNGSVTVNGLNGQTTCLVYAQALSGATIFFEASTDGSFAQSSPGVPVSTAAGVVIPAGSAASAAGYYFAPAPLGSFRARLVYSSGTPVMSLNCYAGASTPLTGTVSATIVGPGASAATPAYVQQTNSGVSIDPRVISFVSAQPVTGTFFQATQPVSCASGATCPVNATIQGIPTVQPGNTQNTTPWLVGGGSTLTILTSASATACTNIAATATRLWSITNSGPATTVFHGFYNDSGTTCGTTSAVYGDAATVTLGAGQVIVFPGGMPLAGLAYKLSGALTAGQNLIVITGPQ